MLKLSLKKTWKDSLLMAKNALLDIDIWKDQVTEIYKEKKGKFRVSIKNFIQESTDNEKTLQQIVDYIGKTPKLEKLYEELRYTPKKLARYLKNQADEIIYMGEDKFTVDTNILEKKDYKTPEEYRKGDFKIYKREDGNLSLTFLLGKVKLGWEIQISSDDDIFDLFGKSGKYPAKIQRTVSKEKLIDTGRITLGVQRHGYHEYFLKGGKFDTKLHLRVVQFKDQKQWLAFSSFVREPVEPSSDEGIWDIREDENKNLSFTSLE